ALKQVVDVEGTEESGVTRFARLCGSGIFNDPNDMSLALVAGMLICAYGLTDKQAGPLRVVFLPLLGLFMTGIALTPSRGGLLSLLAGMVVFFKMRFGWLKTVGLTILGLPLLFFMLSERQTELSANESTGQQRIQLWSDGFEQMKSSPLFGIGEGNFAKE